MEISSIGILVGISLGLFIVAVISMVMAVLAWAAVIGFKNSTHKIEYYNPLANLGADSNIDDAAKQMRKAFGYTEDDHI